MASHCSATWHASLILRVWDHPLFYALQHHFELVHRHRLRAGHRSSFYARLREAQVPNGCQYHPLFYALLAEALITGQTDQSEAYSSNALAPGKYFALVSSSAIDKSHEDVSRLLQNRSHAQEVIIGAGTTMAVALAPGPAE